MPRWTLTHDTITEGDTVGVLLSNRPERAWLRQEDYERIVQAHGFKAWCWVDRERAVCVKPAAGKRVSVARLVLECGRGGYVHYSGDGDRLNLRREALSIEAYRGPNGKQAALRGSSTRPYQPRRAAPDVRPVTPPPQLHERPQSLPSVIASRLQKMAVVVQTVKRNRT